jgi:hypothetical protein
MEPLEVDSRVRVRIEECLVGQWSYCSDWNVSIVEVGAN